VSSACCCNMLSLLYLFFKRESRVKRDNYNYTREERDSLSFQAIPPSYYYENESPSSNNDMDVKSQNGQFKGRMTSEEFIYQQVEKYFLSKNDMFRFHTGQILSTKEPFSESYIRELQTRFSLLVDDPEMDEEERERLSNVLRFMEDAFRFVNYFSSKGINTTVTEVIEVVRDVNRRHCEESHKRIDEQIYRVISERVHDQPSEHEIIKHFLKYCEEKYCEEIDGGDLMYASVLVDLPPLLTRFGCKHAGDIDNLDDLLDNVMQVSKELEAEEFEIYLDDSYDEMEVFNTDSQANRTCIPSKVKQEVWRRDQGRCVECGSKGNLEYDHIIPVSKGGSSTTRNIQILCQDCNRKKSNKIK